MCNCIREVEERLLKNADKLNLPTDMEIKRIRLGGVATMYQSGDQMSGVATVITEPYGKGKRTSKEINIAFRYCPFCGEKYD